MKKAVTCRKAVHRIRDEERLVERRRVRLGWSNDFISVQWLPGLSAHHRRSRAWTEGQGRSRAACSRPDTEQSDFGSTAGKLKGAIVSRTGARYKAFVQPLRRAFGAGPQELVETPIPVKPKSEPDKRSFEVEELQGFFRTEGVAF